LENYRGDGKPTGKNFIGGLDGLDRKDGNPLYARKRGRKKGPGEKEEDFQGLGKILKGRGNGIPFSIGPFSGLEGVKGRGGNNWG